MSKTLDVSQVSLFNYHLCSCYLKYDLWTISLNITWKLIKRENLRSHLDLLRICILTTFPGPHVRTHSNLSGTELCNFQHHDLSRSPFHCLWSRGNNFSSTSLLWGLNTWTCKTSVFGSSISGNPPHIHTHTQVNKIKQQGGDWAGCIGAGNKMLLTGIIVDV